VTHDNVLLQLRPSKIEKPMFETQFLRGEVFVSRTRDRNGGWNRRPDDLEVRRPNFDVSRCEICVAHRVRARDNLALEKNDSFRTQGRGGGADVGRTGARIERRLNDSRTVSKIDEREPTEISAAMNPAPESNVLTDVLFAERAGEMCTMGCREMVCRHQCWESERRAAVVARLPLDRALV